MIDNRTKMLIKNLTYKVNQKTFFDNLSINFLPYGISVILGPNGAGKSLITKILKGIIKPEGVEVSVKINNMKPEVGYLSQNIVFLRRNVFNNLAYPMQIRGLSNEIISKRVNFLLNHFDFTKSKDISARNLSKGNKQYLSFIRALVNDPSVLILDEPTSNLDMNYTKKIENYLLTKKENTKIIMVTHDLFQAKRLADEIVFMNSGKLVEISKTETFLKSSNKLVKKFLNGSLF